MSKPVSIDALASSIRAIHSQDAPRAEKAIEQYLESELGEFDPADRVVFLERLARRFETGTPEETSGNGPAAEVLAGLISLFMGQRISEVDLNSPDLPARLAQSLNTVFDCVNEIISVINATLLGKETEQVTIRHIIGTNLQDESGAASLEDYLGQIRRAFVTSHQAFQQTARTKVGEILQELDPDRIAAIEAGGMKFGKLKKAGAFDSYNEKFQKVLKWFRSDRFMQDLLREFEKNCIKLHR